MSTRRSLYSVKPPTHPTYETHKAEFRAQDPSDENPGLMQTMEDSSLKPLGRLTDILFKVRKGLLILRDTDDEKIPPNESLKTKGQRKKDVSAPG